MKILKESFIKESYGPVTLSSAELYDYGYDIEGDVGRFAQGTFKDGVDFDVVVDCKYNDMEVQIFDDDQYIFRIPDVSTESATSDLITKLEGMTSDEAKKKYKSIFESTQKEDTVKTKSGKWTNKGKEGTHGEFDTKKQADAQRKAMYANGYKG